MAKTTNVVPEKVHFALSVVQCIPAGPVGLAAAGDAGHHHDQTDPACRVRCAALAVIEEYLTGVKPAPAPSPAPPAAE
jgi:hypothetical protein